jgi:hypothetical protein
MDSDLRALDFPLRSGRFFDETVGDEIDWFRETF